MLIRFEASNFRSIHDPIELSMVAVDGDREAARAAPHLGASLLTVAAIFGPNASGKSNIIAALTWLREGIQYSHRLWDDEIPVEPFAFGDGPATTTQFAVELLIDNVRFEYVLELDGQGIHYEGLFHYPEKKRRRIFEREGNNLKLQRGLGNLSGTRELLTNRTLVLSVARRFNEPLVSNFANELIHIQTMGLQSRRPRIIGGGNYYRSTETSLRSTLRWFEDSTQLDHPTLFAGETDVADPLLEDRKQALALLKLADLGIDDVMIDEQEVPYSDPDVTITRTRKRVRLVHKTASERTPLEFSSESEGTRTWFRLIGPVLAALRTGSLLLFDELDASLHPTLSAQLIKLFHERSTNPHGAQLIFTSHDASLLNHLNRDEVWLTEKSEDGSTRLGALAEFAGERVRKSQNLESAYLHGRFGALPDVDQTEFLRTLGLIG